MVDQRFSPELQQAITERLVIINEEANTAAISQRAVATQVEESGVVFADINRIQELKAELERLGYTVVDLNDGQLSA